MRKLFRMKYEPCSGQCYAPHEVLDLQKANTTDEEARELLRRIIRIHEPACGNDQIAYGVDYDDKTKVFVGTFQHYGALEVVVEPSALECLLTLCDSVDAWLATDPKDLKDRPGKGHEVCVHGKDDDLLNFALQCSGLSKERQAKIRAA